MTRLCLITLQKIVDRDLGHQEDNTKSKKCVLLKRRNGFNSIDSIVNIWVYI